MAYFKRLMTAAFFLIVCSTVLAQNESSSKRLSAISVTLTAPHSVVKSGSIVEVAVTVTNTSDQVFTYVQQAVADHGGFDYKFAVQRSNGSEPPHTEFGQALMGRDNPKYLTRNTPLSGSLSYREFRPGQRFTSTVNLSRLYDLQQSGIYTIEAKVFDSHDKRIVTSNLIKITVTK